MTRPRSFDEPEVLDAAINCFWRRGYAATSMRDLSGEMGLGSASLYNAFSDKRTLFVRALDRYLDQTMRERIARLERTVPPKRAIKEFIAEIVERSVDDPHQRGCMLINAAAEIAPLDRDLGLHIAACLDELLSFFRRCLVRGQADGSIPPNRDPTEIAALLLAVVMGIRVLARAKPDRKLLKKIAKPALALLD
jgi:TetR/AcrR family transcriptional repressor of nem operon